MSKPARPRVRVAPTDHRESSRRVPESLLVQRGLDPDPTGSLPKIRLRSVRRHPLIFRKMVGEIDAAVGPGDLVSVWTPDGQLFGHGVFNPRAEIALRMVNFTSVPPGSGFWRDRLAAAVRLRRDLLRLDADTDSYRVLHAEADGFPGLVIDRYGDVLSAEAFSLAMYQRSQAILVELSPLLGTKHSLIQVPDQAHGQEGFLAKPTLSEGCPDEVVMTEFGTKFRVRFTEGHKTGFFCDQRENRRKLAEFCKDKSVLDLCCYTGGFAVQAKRLGGAGEVTAVDLDETAIALAKDNARLNQAKVHFIHADVFGYMRDMIANARLYDVVILDPPKLIRNRRELEEGARKHLDLNRLAIQLVKPGGLLLSCTCSGLLGSEEFLRLLHTAARQAGSREPRGQEALSNSTRSVQILAKTGAAADHPVSLDCPETEYLQAVWLRVLA